MDLTGKLPVGARKIRITTNLQIYWDRVRVDNGPEVASDVRQTDVPLAMAHLAFRGYPKQIEGATPGELTYDYNQISATGPFLWARGMYTRYGDVTPLLKSIDNRYVIFGTGEEIDAEFSAGGVAGAACGMDAGLFLLRERLREGYGLVGGVRRLRWRRCRSTESRYPYPASQHYPETPVRIDTGWSGMTGLSRAIASRSGISITSLRRRSRYTRHQAAGRRQQGKIV